MSTKKKYGLDDFSKDFGVLNFADALESYRICEEMSQKELAEKLKISSQSLCDLEKGRRIPTASRAASIAKILKQPVAFWVQLAIQDSLDKEKLRLKIKIEAA